MILVETKKQQPAKKLDDLVPEVCEFSSNSKSFIIILLDSNFESPDVQMCEKSVKKIVILHSLGWGFGNLKATIDNLPPETAEPKLHETSEMILKVASNLCSRIVDRCCCMCFIQFCGQLNDRCAIVLAQLCTALACCECINFCCELCDLCSG